MGYVRDLSGVSCSVTTTAAPPFLITSATQSWLDIWGYTEAEAIGKDIAILNGSGYDKAASDELLQHFLSHSSTVPVRCTNVSKDGTLYSHDSVLSARGDSITCSSRNFVPAIIEREVQAIRRRDVYRKVSGAEKFAPRVTATYDKERGCHVLEARVPSTEVECIWVRLDGTFEEKRIAPGCFSVDGSTMLFCDLPAGVVESSPCIRAFSFSAKAGSWASPDLEICGRRKGYLVLRERMAPEVEGDVGMVYSPRDGV